MKAVSAIFTKQLNDFPKNISIALLYILYPALAAAMTLIIGDDFFVVTFAMMFVGVTPMITMANTIAEDNEYKSLRFLVMAGVRPLQYLAGLGTFVLSMSLLPLAAFALIGNFTTDMLLTFFPVALLGCVVSAILGGVVGIFSKNVQQCSAIYTPLMLLISFLPFLATFNEALSNIAQVLFTHQALIIMIEMTGGNVDPISPGGAFSLALSMAIIAANLVVFAILFAVAYKKKGLKG